MMTTERIQGWQSSLSNTLVFNKTNKTLRNLIFGYLSFKQYSGSDAKEIEWLVSQGYFDCPNEFSNLYRAIDDKIHNNREIERIFTKSYAFFVDNR